METRDQTFVDEASQESFPASDAPAFNPIHAGTPDARASRVETPRDVRAYLRADVDALSGAPYARSPADHVARGLLDAGRSVTRIPVGALETIEARITGVLEGPELIVGARAASVGAAAVLLSLARVLQGRRFVRGVRLVAFADDGHTPSVGSRAYAKRLHDDRRHLVGMIDIESVGFSRSRAWHRDFLAIIGNLRARPLVHDARLAFHQSTDLRVYGVALPAFLPLVRSSDHVAFGRHGFSAMTLTDSGPLRYPGRRSAGERPDLLDYDRMSDVVFGLASVVARLAGGEGAT